MTSLQAAFAALAQQKDATEHATEYPYRSKFYQVDAPVSTKRLPYKQYVAQKQELHKELGPFYLMFQNVHPKTNRSELVAEIKKRIPDDFVLYERGNTGFDRDTHAYAYRTYPHKLFFARFQNEVPLDLVYKVRGIELNGRTIFVRRADYTLNQERCVFLRGVRGTCNIQDAIIKTNYFVQSFDKDLHVDDIKMLYTDQKLRGFMYLEFNKKIPREVGDRVFMKAFYVNGNYMQLKKYVGSKKLAKQKIADRLGYKKYAMPNRTIRTSEAMKRGERRE